MDQRTQYRTVGASPQIGQVTPMPPTVPQQLASPMIGLMPVRFDPSTTYQSPLFWLVGGIVIGVWISRSRSIF